MHNATPTTDIFQDYVDHGLALVKIVPGKKGPNLSQWNRKERAITSVEDLETQQPRAVGLAHAWSDPPTVSIDIDRLEDARDYLTEHGVELDALLDADDAVQIVSGQQDRAKLIYRLPEGAEPLPTKKLAAGALELRCSSKTGFTVQDVLPPAPHPSGSQYAWGGNGTWRKIPVIPRHLQELWRKEAGLDQPERLAMPGTDHQGRPDDIEKLLGSISPDADYEDWIRAGMALHHELGDAGFDYWDNWSSKGSKYKGPQDLQTHWDSFGQGGDGGRPVTLGSLRRQDIATADEFDDLDQVDNTYDDIWGKQEEVEPYEFLDMNQLENLPDPDWIIEGVLPVTEVGTVFGPPGSGKTFAALDLSLSVARGVAWRELETKQGGVLYIAAEDDAGVRLRLRAYRDHYGLDNNLPIRTLCAAPNISDKKVQKALRKAVKHAAAEVDARLIVVDTLASVMPGADENASKDVTPVVDYCKTLHKDTGATVIVVHHSGKDMSKGPRGSSALHGAFGVELLVAEDSKGNYILVDKMKNGPAGERFSFKLQVVEIGDLTSCIVDHMPDFGLIDDVSSRRPKGKWQRAVWDLLKDEPLGLSFEGLVRRLADDCEYSEWRLKQRITRACKNLRDGGHTELRQGVWRIPSEVDDLLYGDDEHVHSE